MSLKRSLGGRTWRPAALIVTATPAAVAAVGPRVEAATKLVSAYAAISGAFACHGLDSSLAYISSSTVSPYHPRHG